MQQIKWLDSVIVEAEKSLQHIPEGTLHIKYCRNTLQYYWRSPEDTRKEKYIKRSDEKLVKQLAQKDYAMKLIEFATRKKEELEKNVLVYDSDEIVNFHHRLSLERQALITPVVMSDQVYSELWLERGKIESRDASPYSLDMDSGIMTERGELVRSKMEKIIADKLYLMNIPYIYERPLTLQGGGRIYPDFTVLNQKTRKEYYWEHFGMMDKQDYCENAVKKISKYQKNKIYMGTGLIATFETNTQYLNMKELEGIINEFLL